MWDFKLCKGVFIECVYRVLYNLNINTYQIYIGLPELPPSAVIFFITFVLIVLHIVQLHYK